MKIYRNKSEQIVPFCVDVTANLDPPTADYLLKKEVIKNYLDYLNQIKDDEKWMVNIRKQDQGQETSVDFSLSENNLNMALKNGF